MKKKRRGRKKKRRGMNDQRWCIRYALATLHIAQGHPSYGGHFAVKSEWRMNVPLERRSVIDPRRRYGRTFEGLALRGFSRAETNPRIKPAIQSVRTHSYPTRFTAHIPHK